MIFGVGPTTLFYFLNNIKTYYYWQRRVCNAVCNELAIANGNKAVPVFAEVKIPAGRSLDVAITMNINNMDDGRAKYRSVQELRNLTEKLYCDEGIK